MKAVAKLLDAANSGEPFNVKVILFKLLYEAYVDALATAASLNAPYSGIAQKAVKALINLAKLCAKGDCFSIADWVKWIVEQALSEIAKINGGKSAIDAYKVGQAMGKVAIVVFLIRQADPPLPAFRLGNGSPLGASSVVTASVNVAATLPNGAIAGNLTTAHFLLADSLSNTLGFYAPSLAGLGIGGQWPGNPFANFAANGTATLQNASVLLDSSSGSLTLNGSLINLANGVALAQVNGTLSVSEQSATQDQVQLTGTGSAFLLSLSAASSAINPVDSVAFSANIASSFADVFTLTVQAPAEWQASVDAAGNITLHPPAGAAQQAYTVLVTARSRAFPHLSVSAAHTVNVAAYQGMLLNVSPDPSITVPWGPCRRSAR